MGEGVTQLKEMGILDGYCYGPADLVKVWKSPHILWLLLTDSVGKRAEAVYEDCAYLPNKNGYAGMHLSFVQQMTASQILAKEASAPTKAMLKDSGLTEENLRDLEEAGIKFFVHIGSHTEFLVAARKLNYRTLD